VRLGESHAMANPSNWYSWGGDLMEQWMMRKLMLQRLNDIGSSDDVEE
jgi:hypothetical protein